MKSTRAFNFAGAGRLGRTIGIAVAFATLLAATLWGCKPGTQGPAPMSKAADDFTVRGYLAVVVGGTGMAEKYGIFARGAPQKNIFIPGVEVYLSDPQSGRTSSPAKTDLSGRFTLFAPVKGRYQLCWKSKVYEDGCTATFIDANGQAQFLSTVFMSLPRKQDFVAVTGNIRDADGDSVRTLDPYLNINAFAAVGLQDAQGATLADVYANNFGDYLLPYVPAKQSLKVVAQIEAAKYVQEIDTQADIRVAALNQLNLKFANSRPRLDPLTALDAATNRRVQNALPGSTLKLKANARDRDGDPVNFAWFVEPSEGQLSQTTGAAIDWKIPTAPGRYTATVVAYDKKGGYDKAVVSVLADGNGIPFTGVVVEPNGIPVGSAAVEIVGNPGVSTDANGRFRLNVKEADRYVFNIRKQGYALNSQIYNGAVTGGRWILRPAQVVTIDPTRDATISHRRTQRDCPGLGSWSAGLGAAGQSLLTPQWQDGKGAVIDAPSDAVGIQSLAQLSPDRLNKDKRGKRPLFFPPRGLKQTECGPGISVDIPANSILDASGNPATAPLNVSIATVDLQSPQQMPGDDAVVPLAGGGGYIQSFGAGSLDLPVGFKLKPGAQAKITIPVDRARLNAGALASTVPLLAYDEQQGVWREEDKLTLTNAGGVQAYVGKVKHFTSYNADTFFNNAACLRVFSPSLPGQYNLEVMSPYPDGTPHYKNYPIDNVSSTEHVIYNITPNANMTLAPMTTGPNPQLLGFYIVNSGPPQNPSNSPNVPPGPPYASCQNFVVLKIGSAPDSPQGGEFLHGLGYIGAENLGFDDLTSAGPTGNALRDAIVTASKNYYTQVDPLGNRDTFAEFKSNNGFSADPNVPAAGELVTQFANTGDLGFGRDMHCKKNGASVACYVTNYGTGYNNLHPGAGTDDHDDADAAGQRATVGLSKELATVAMEYRPIDNDPAGDRVVKFYVYKKDFPNVGDYNRSISANLDGRGERPVPQLCMICHGGQVPQQAGGAPIFNAANDVKLNSRFLPFDHRLYTFPTTPALPASAQEAGFKSMNQTIVDIVPTGAPTSDPVREVVRALYNDATHTNSPTQLLDSPVAGWKTGASSAAAGQQNFYDKVFANGCRTCHIAQPFAQLQFNTSQKFLHVATSQVGANNFLMLGTAQSRVCGDYTMPHALRTHDIFWSVYTDINPVIAAISMPNQFQAFGDGLGGAATAGVWKPGLCTSFQAGTVSNPSNFYQRDIQTIWNGKCVACHIAGGPAPFSLTDGNSFGNLVPSRVVAGNDNPAAPGNALLSRITAASAGARMPPSCYRAPEPPNGNLPCLPTVDVEKIKAWIRSGAH